MFKGFAQFLIQIDELKNRNSTNSCVEYIEEYFYRKSSILSSFSFYGDQCPSSVVLRFGKRTEVGILVGIFIGIRWNTAIIYINGDYCM